MPDHSVPATSSSTESGIAAGGNRLSEMLGQLKPIFELEKLVVPALEDMGLSDVSVSESLSAAPPKVDFTVLHFVILPRQSAWLDFLLEADRASALQIFSAMSGESEAADDDLADVLRETMNLIHGNLKSALRREVTDLIIPVVPQSIDTAKLVGAVGGYSLQLRQVFTAPGVTVRLTMVARAAPVTHKFLHQLRLAHVLVDPLTPGDDQNLVIVKQHTMLNERLVEKVHRMAECEAEHVRHAVVEPSPLAELVGRK